MIQGNTRDGNQKCRKHISKGLSRQQCCEWACVTGQKGLGQIILINTAEWKPCPPCRARLLPSLIMRQNRFCNSPSCSRRRQPIFCQVNYLLRRDQISEISPTWLEHRSGTFIRLLLEKQERSHSWEFLLWLADLRQNVVLPGKAGVQWPEVRLGEGDASMSNWPSSWTASWSQLTASPKLLVNSLKGWMPSLTSKIYDLFVDVITKLYTYLVTCNSIQTTSMKSWNTENKNLKSSCFNSLTKKIPSGFDSCSWVKTN